MSIKNSVRYLTYLALKEILLDHGYSNVVIDYYLKNNSLKDEDRRLFTNLVYGVTFYDLRLNYELSPFLKVAKTDPKTLLVIKIAIFQMFYLEKIPDYAALNEAIEITKVVNRNAVKFVTAVLHQARRSGLKPVEKIEDPIKRLSMEYSIPDWIVSKLNLQLGLIRTESIFKSLLFKPRASLRVNTKKISRQDLIASQPNFYTESNISPVGVIALKGNVMRNEDFKTGLYTVQDESSQLASLNLKVEKSDVVLDACCAPGGKTTHIAQYLDSKSGGVVYAFDTSKRKLSLVKQNVNRLGLEDVVKLYHSDIRCIRKVLPNVMFDKILVDAPCSGFGLLRRKPEVKYNHEASDIIGARQLQLEILNAVVSRLKPGGMLLYSTCTIFKEETETVVTEFIAGHPSFNLVNLTVNPKKEQKPMMQIFPDDFGTDGFFIALIQKQEA